MNIEKFVALGNFVKPTPEEKCPQLISVHIQGQPNPQVFRAIGNMVKKLTNKDGSFRKTRKPYVQDPHYFVGEGAD